VEPLVLFVKVLILTSPARVITRSMCMVLALAMGDYIGVRRLDRTVIPNQSTSASWSATLCVGCVANYTSTSSAGQIFGTAVTYGGSNCEGSIWAINRTSSGSDVGSWVQVAASNTGGGNDGGSGMWNTSSFVFPMLTGASYIAFKGGGCHGGTVNVYATSS